MRYLCFNKQEKIKPVWAFHTVGRKGAASFVSAPGKPWLFLGYKGTKRFKTNDKEFLLERGSFHVIFPDTSTSSSIAENCDQSDFCCEFVLPSDYFIVEADSIEDVMDKKLCVLPEFAKINDCEKYFVLFSQLLDELNNLRVSGMFREEICDNYTKILLCSLSDAVLRYNGDSKKRISTEKVFFWLQSNAKKGISASDAAKALNYNADYLNQIVKSETGMTLTRYLNTLRIAEAKNLLLSSDMSIAQIALEVGFSDEKYFMKVFKSCENLSPTRYRNVYFR